MSREKTEKSTLSLRTEHRPPTGDDAIAQRQALIKLGRDKRLTEVLRKHAALLQFSFDLLKRSKHCKKDNESSKAKYSGMQHRNAHARPH